MKFKFDLLEGMYEANATIASIIHLPTATLLHSSSDQIEEFISSIDNDLVKSAAKKFPHLESVLNCIIKNNDTDFDMENMQQLYRDAGEVEFVAQIYVAMPRNFRLDDAGNFLSCSLSGVCRSVWIFGEDMQQVAEQAIEFGNELFEKELKKARESA